MTARLAALWIAGSLAHSNLAHAGQDADALACVKTKVWESYTDGWSLRTMRGSELSLNDRRTAMVSLYPGRSYRFMACGTEGVGDLDLLLYDVDGNVVRRDSTTDRQPMLEVTDLSGTYYLVVHVRSLVAPGLGGVAVAVTHK